MNAWIDSLTLAQLDIAIMVIEAVGVTAFGFVMYCIKHMEF